MGETQPKGLEEAQLRDLLEGEMVEAFIPKAPLERNERYSQVEEWSGPTSEGRRGVMLISIPLQPTAGIQEPFQSLPHQKTDSSQIGVVLGQDLHL